MTKKIFSMFFIFALVICGCAPDADGTSTINEYESSGPTIDENGASSITDPLNDKSVEEILSSMTLDQKIGQMLMLSIRSWDDSPVNSTIPSDLQEMISKYYVGNIILFAENFSTVEDTVKLTSSLQNALDINIPMFISVDQEGGNVVRLSEGCSLPGNMALGAIGLEESSYTAGVITGKQLYALGVNTNFAPSLDVNNNPQNPVINIRSFSEDPTIVASLGSAMISGIQSQNVSACAKHFPGHGDTQTDSHVGLPTIYKTLEELQSTELIPFQSAIDSGIDMIMTGHIQFPQIEHKKINDIFVPATLSQKIITEILKEEMGFDGVVVTDSLQMDAISQNFSTEEGAILSIAAGADILLMPLSVLNAGETEKLEALIASIKNAVETNRISEERINDAVTRILKVKKTRNLWEVSKVNIEEKISSSLSVIGNAEDKATERELASKAITVLENKTGELFSSLSQNGNVLFCVPSESIKTNVEFAIERLKKENSFDLNYNVRIYDQEKSTKGLDVTSFDGVIVFTDTTSSWKVSGAVEIYDKARLKGVPVGVVSCRLPYDASLFTAADCLLVCYCPKGDAPQNETSAFGVNIPAAIEVIFGVSQGEGKLPVTIFKTSSNGTIDFNTVIYPLGFSQMG